MDLVHGLLATDKKMREEHIGFILKEVIQVNFAKLIERNEARRSAGNTAISSYQILFRDNPYGLFIRRFNLERTAFL